MDPEILDYDRGQLLGYAAVTDALKAQADALSAQRLTDPIPESDAAEWDNSPECLRHYMLDQAERATVAELRLEVATRQLNAMGALVNRLGKQVNALAERVADLAPDESEAWKNGRTDDTDD